MIQVNLLPDVKREYLHAQQMKHMFTMISVLATLTAFILAGVLFAYVQFVQPRHRSNLQKDIDAGIQDLKNKPDGVEIVTVQGVLEQMPALQDKKLITSKLFDYLTEFTPRDVSYGEVKLDLENGTLTLNGQTTTLERANVLANNLKSANFTYTLDGKEQNLKPFSNIIFTNLGKTQDAGVNRSVGFELTLQIDKILFDQKLSDTKIAVNAAAEELSLPTAQPFNESNATSGVTQ